MLKTAISLALLCCATPALAQQDDSYVFVTASGRSVLMSSTQVAGPQADRRVTMLLVATDAPATGSNNYIFEFSANCTDRTYRYVAVEGFTGTQSNGRTPGDSGYRQAEPGTLNDAGLIFACDGKMQSDDRTVVRGIDAARRYAPTKASANP